ncbi:MAG: hypothetical protein NUV77_23010 [Thermoguttaceae bacterium]|nr:hypothetical protein [Thermoguttaceae bacterium]
MSKIVEIADAVVQEFNGGQFSQPVEAQRYYRPTFELAQMKTLHVSVVPKGITIAGLSRSADQHEYQLDVAVQKKLAGEGLEEIDGLLTLVEEIADHFRTPRLASLAGVLCVKVENAPVYAVEHIEEMRLFTSVLTLTFRVTR